MVLIAHNRLLCKPWCPDDRPALVLPAARPVPRPMAGPENAGLAATSGKLDAKVAPPGSVTVKRGPVETPLGERQGRGRKGGRTGAATVSRR